MFLKYYINYFAYRINYCPVKTSNYRHLTMQIYKFNFILSKIQQKIFHFVILHHQSILFLMFFVSLQQ